METVDVTIKPDIARSGRGFIDIEHGQELFPFEKGTLKADKVFSVVKTRFIRSKLDTGELVLAETEKQNSSQKDFKDEAGMTSKQAVKQCVKLIKTGSLEEAETIIGLLKKHDQESDEVANLEKLLSEAKDNA